MKLLDINDGIDINKLITFCNTAHSDNMPAAQNMNTEDWANKSNTLLHSIFIQQRFSREKRAGYLIIEAGHQYVAGAGFNQLDTDSNICLTSTRTYTVPSLRGHKIHGDYIIPRQIELARRFKYKTLVWSFQDYNLKLKNYILKVTSGDLGILSFKPSHSLYNWIPLEHTVNIQHTKQWVLYKHLDNNYHDNFIKSMADIRCD